MFSIHTVLACFLQLRHITRVITPEEYDAAVHSTPHLCPLLLAGDWRTGRQLLADAPSDSEETMASLVASRRGAGLLGSLASAVEGLAVEAEARLAGLTAE